MGLSHKTESYSLKTKFALIASYLNKIGFIINVYLIKKHWLPVIDIKNNNCEKMFVKNGFRTILIEDRQNFLSLIVF